MRVPIGREALLSRTAERTFTCRRCGHSATADVTAWGKGAESYLADEGTAQKRAFAEATKDLDRTIRLARCPACKRRNPGELLRFWAFPAMMFGLMLVVGLVVGVVVQMRPWWLMPAVTGASALFITPSVALGRWRKLDERVRWSS